MSTFRGSLRIAYNNPRTYPICTAILSKLINLLETTAEKQLVIEKTKKKFSQIPNTGHMQLWLQRISLPFAPTMDFDEPLCRLILGENEQIWNSEWISSDELKGAVAAYKIIDRQVIENLGPIVPEEEIALFVANTEYNS